MLFPENIKIKILEILNSQFNGEIRIFAIQPIFGGDINKAAKVISSVGNFFVKWNDANKFPEMFHMESKGLRLLAESHCIKIPKVISENSLIDFSFLLLEWLESGKPKSDFWNHFGKALAKLHQNSNNYFGLDHNNFIGSLYQSNHFHEDWISFFIEERLQPQLKLAFNTYLIDSAVLKAADQLFKVLGEIIPTEPPALLHGDLWSGNFMVDFIGNPCLIDPAVYFGHREMDLAMTKLFGGFSSKFYEAYHFHYPLEKGWDKRMDIHNLYPLLVHVNLFGAQYISQVTSILNKFKR